MLSGLLAWACTAGLGVATLLAATTSYAVLKVAGAAYLAGLGGWLLVPGRPVLLICLGMALVHIALGVLWFVGVSWLAGRLGEVLRRRRVRVALDGFTGTAVLGFAARLALSQRA